MGTEPTITAAAARRFPGEHLSERIVEVRPLAGGTWSQAFAFVAGRRELVVRFGHHVDDYRKDGRAGTWRVPGVPIPRVLEVGEAFDGQFAISTRAHGEPLEEASPQEWAVMVPVVLDLIARFADLPAEGYGYGRWGPDGHGFLPRRERAPPSLPIRPGRPSCGAWAGTTTRPAASTAGGRRWRTTPRRPPRSPAGCKPWSS